jgi:formate dehydrogenase major subunit
MATTDQPNAEFDLHLNNGRLLEHFHEGNMTYASREFARRLPTLLSKSPRSTRKSVGFRAALGCN